MARTLPYLVILPANYEDVDRRNPVLFLLHGLFGSFENWTDLTSIVKQAEDHRLIVVTPEAGDGWYTDGATVETDRYESFFLFELLPEIERLYGTIGNRSGRAVAGLSMGGYGAFKFALKRPHLFKLAVSFSGAFDPTERTDDAPGFDWEDLKPSITKAFGPPGSHTRADNDLFKLIETLPEQSISELPFFYFNCGTRDGFLPANQRLDRCMTARGIAHKFEEFEGGHDWDYWSSQLAGLLTLVTRTLTGAEKTDEDLPD